MVRYGLHRNRNIVAYICRNMKDTFIIAEVTHMYLTITVKTLKDSKYKYIDPLKYSRVRYSRTFHCGVCWHYSLHCLTIVTVF